jgi:TROVE domain
MARFNHSPERVLTPEVPPVERPAVSGSPIRQAGRTRNAFGVPAWDSDAMGRLYLAACTSFAADQFHEGAQHRADRMASLMRTLVRTDPETVAVFIPWVRDVGGMRSAAVQLAVEYALAAKELNRSELRALPVVRGVVDGALRRADEVGEFVAYWQTRTDLPIAGGVKRGLADAARRMFGERAALRWDSPKAAWRLADILAVMHPKPRDERQAAVWRWLLDTRHDRPNPRYDAELTPMIARRNALEAISQHLRRPALLTPEFSGEIEAAGMSWEQVAGWLGGPMDAAAWETVIPNMGYMALLRNLRNFDKAGISDGVARRVCARLSDPEQVRKSRQFPFRFWSAYRAVPSDRWSWALEQALSHSLSNLPELPGRTLIMIDTSWSMRDPLSSRSDVARWDVSALFGLALAARCESSTVVSFSSPDGTYKDGRIGAEWVATPLSKVFPAVPGESVLRSIKRFEEGGYFIGSNTHTAAAVRLHYHGEYDRIVILTDEQNQDGDPLRPVPESVPVYTINVAGYAAGHEHGTLTRVRLGGVSDAAFRVIPICEGLRGATWADLLAPAEEEAPVG